MPKYTLTSFPLCPYVQRAIIVLSEKNVEYDRVDIDLANKPDWFLKLSPLGKVPVLQADDSVLFESQVIAEYLDEVTEDSLHPADPLEKARHRAWIEFASQTQAAIFQLFFATDKVDYETKRAAVADKLATVEKEVSGPFFGGDKFNMIDGVWAITFRYFATLSKLDDFDFYLGSKKLKAWHDAVKVRPSVQQAAPADYDEQLFNFVKGKDSYLSGLANAKVAA